MSILGIGPLELFFIVIIALIILGPRDMVKAGKSIGRLMRRTIFSPTWVNVQNKVRNLPYELMREAGLEEEDFKIDPKQIDLGLDKAKILQESTAQYAKDIEKSIDIPSEWTAPAAAGAAAAKSDGSSSLKPAVDDSAEETETPADGGVGDTPEEGGLSSESSAAEPASEPKTETAPETAPEPEPETPPAPDKPELKFAANKPGTSHETPGEI